MRKRNRRQINRYVFLGAFFVAGICFLYLLLMINGLSYQDSIKNTPKANITLIPGPAIATMDVGLLTSITPTATIDPNIPNTEGILVGSYVQIGGTGGNGLRIRSNPGTSADTNFIGNESEVFLVIGGPIEMDGFVWWQLSAPYDQSRQGWAASEYLDLIS